MTNTQLDMRGRDFVALADYTQEELYALMHYGIELKRKQKAGDPEQALRGKSLAMIFEKSSTRTRVSFEVGMFQLGGTALFLSKNDIQIGRGETIYDTAQTLSRYVDGIMIRTFAHRTVIDLARAATVPVINGLSDLNHPCQALADYMTIYEKKGKLEGLKVAYVGDGNNMAHSLIMGASKFGINITVATPNNYAPDADVVKQAQEQGKLYGSTITLTNDPREAVADADVVYTDVWASMGFESEQQKRELAFRDFQVDEELVKWAKSDYLFMHCLPAHRGEEVSEGVIDGNRSIVFDQAENRLHAQKAVLASLMRD
ncbi:ornithine carbamoyltransferase [Paenibacillus sp. ACRRX]|uniref:ornithine carbamoyltransferase n=1 Tax=unclassified Paenibacillus TaxID=185978 RepID=UPI001EF68645|nr:MULTISPECIES: ornithine carbamoyltransferase [unclassified Paenibacillus]MCG7407968.1 ornithine carbamoyltransferase [Paenibacillus sp. ACRRX]MDK8181651.1 ornithine carbamoyltransferase [Paenibacillus sp. UMB4589-SE434]